MTRPPTIPKPGPAVPRSSRQAERVAAVKDVRGERAPKGRHIASDELTALLRACSDDHSPAGRRDAGDYRPGLVDGRRRSELAGLTFC